MSGAARSIAIAVGFATAMPGVAVARTAGPPKASESRTVTPRYASVVVDATATGDVGPVLRRRVQERADVLLRRNDVLPARNPDDTTVSVTVHEATGKDPGFEFTLAVTSSGARVGDVISAKCELCTESELVDAVESKLEGVIAELEPPKAAEAPADDPVAPLTRQQDPPVDQDRRKIGGKGIAGAVLLAGGAAGIIVGGTLAALPDKPKVDEPLFEKTTKPPGFALLGVGVGLAIAGGVLIAVDLTQRKKKRRAALSPSFGRDHVAATVTLQF
jgi:hypothetical protein